jgi:prepilin signal peptidase PulO-like enzyme (type II secretory pathway)
MGMGDIHLIIMLAMFLNWSAILLTIFLSAFSGSIVGTIIKLIQRKTSWRFEIPYGPYIALGAIIAYFWGTGIIAWYLSFYRV